MQMIKDDGVQHVMMMTSRHEEPIMCDDQLHTKSMQSANLSSFLHFIDCCTPEHCPPTSGAVQGVGMTEDTWACAAIASVTDDNGTSFKTGVNQALLSSWTM